MIEAVPNESLNSYIFQGKFKKEKEKNKQHGNSLVKQQRKFACQLSKNLTKKGHEEVGEEIFQLRRAVYHLALQNF